MPDQLIEVEFIVKAQNAIAAAQAYRIAIEQTKLELAALKEQSTLTYKALGEGLKMEEKRRMGGFDPLKQKDFDAKAYQTYAKRVDQAIKEIEAAERELAQTTSTLRKQGVKEAEQLSTQRANYEKQLTKEEAAAYKSLVGEITAVEKKILAIEREHARQREAELARESKNKAKIWQTDAKNFIKSQKEAMKGWWSGLGGIGKTVLTILGIGSIIQLFNTLTSAMKEAVKAGEEFSQSLFRLSVSISQLQRRGLDITIKSEIELIKQLKEQYATFSVKGIVEATAAVQMLTRNFGFSQDQIQKTIELSMDLALVQGKDVAETAKMLALFYSSGYGEGLQRAGLAVNRLTVVQEAHRMGMNKSYMALTEQERAAAGYNLVMRQSQDLHGDAVKIQDSLIGKIKEQRSAIEDVTNEIGLRALPVELMWLKVKLAFVKMLGAQIDETKAFNDTLEEFSVDQQRRIMELAARGMPLPLEFQEKYQDKIEKQRDEWEDQLSETLDVKPDINLDLGGEDQQLAEERQKLGQQIIDVWGDLQEAKAKFDADMEDEERDHANKIEEINQDLIDDLKDLWQEYQNDLSDIQRDLDRDIIDAQAEYQRDLADLERDTQRAIEDANRKYRENQLKAERDFQERMRKLREEFLFDLEDALRERDAKQVLQLIRRYRLDVEQEQRDFEGRMEELAEEHQRELAEIRRHAEERRQELWLGLQRELEDLQIAAQRKRDEAWEDYQQEIADANEAWRQKREDEDAHFKERQKALEDALTARVTKILEAFGGEIAVTGISLDTVSKLFKHFLGDQGVVDTIIDEYLTIIATAAEKQNEYITQMIAGLQQLQTAAAAAGFSGYYPGGLTPAEMQQKTGGQAFGGATFATRPTTALFGESGPELAMFIPQKALSFPNQSMSLPSISGRGGSNGGSARIFIELSPGLIAEVVDNSLGEAAELFTEMMRTR